MNNYEQYMANKVQADPGLPTRVRRWKTYFDIAFQIHRWRTAQGLTQAQLAKKLNTTQPNIARWETPGYARYTISRLIEIAEALGKSLQISFVEANYQTATGSWDINFIENVKQEIDRRSHNVKALKSSADFGYRQTLKGEIINARTFI